MDIQKTLILIDGHALAFRQYFALERTNMKTSDNEPTWAVYGFFKAVFDLLKNKNIKPDSIAVAFDVSHQTFRVAEYSEYKANRAVMPTSLQSQMKLIYEGLKAFNIPIYTKEGFEADDVIGTITEKAKKLGHKTLILTGDQDAFQLIDYDGYVKVLIPSTGGLKEYSWNEVYEKLGVYPDQVIDYKGLRGDTSDNIPGIRGIGEKTAQKLLSRYPNLEEVLADCENIPEKSVKEKICGGKEQAVLSKYLATIVRDVDINFDFDKTNIELPDVVEVTEYLQKLQFYSFIRNCDEILSSFNKAAPKIKCSIPQQTSQMQLGFFADAVKSEINKEDSGFEKKLVTKEDDLYELADVLRKQTLISVKLEAKIKSAVEAELVGIAIAYNDDYQATERLKVKEGENKTKAFYIPISHNIEEQLDKDLVMEVLSPIFGNPKLKKTMHNAKEEYNVLKSYGIETRGVIFDTMLASYIKDPARKHELRIQSLEHLQHVMEEHSPFTSDKKKQKSLFEALINNVLNFKADEVYSILELTKYWNTALDEKELNLIYDMEIPVTLVLAEMEEAGITVDVDYLNEVSKELTTELDKVEKRVYELAGCEFNINSPRQVGEVLYDKLQIKPKKRSRGKAKYSTGAEILEELAEDHEIVEYMLLQRKYSKLKSTYTDALPSLISKKDGRIHTTYNQTNTSTGRLSSSNPNLQNIPIRSEEGNKIRNAFVAADKENGVILAADYSQIELRLLAHVSGDEHLIEAFKSGEDIHTLTASKVFDVPLNEVTRDMRYKAKAVNFGIVYGQTKYGLAKGLKITNREADEFIQRYFKTYPRVKDYMNSKIEFALENGYVETLYGRKRYLASELASSNFQIKEFAQRAAINQPLQGTAADLIKLAMITLNKKLKENHFKSKIIMQVHDELVLEVDKNELEEVHRLVLESMELNQPLSVPLTVDINTGESWKEQ